MTGILLLSRYGRLGASSRLRHAQYLPWLRAAGLHIETAPLFDDAYLEALYAGRRPSVAGVLAAYVRRLSRLVRLRRFDLLWIEKELLPWLPFAVESLFLGRIPYVADYDDAWFHRYDGHPQPLVRALLGRKIDRLMRNAAVVVAGNEYLADRARAAGARQVAILPTVIDLDRYRPRPRVPDAPFTVVWIGTPLTAAYLPMVAGALATVCRDGRGIVHLIGAGADALPDVPVRVLPWSEDTETGLLQTGDVGIMPLPEAAWERGKCGYKLIQYMALGRPVVASPVGVNRTLVQPGITGFLPESDAEWRAALTALRDRPDLRRSMGAAARRLVERRYSVQVTAPRLVEILTGAAASRDRQDPLVKASREA